MKPILPTFISLTSRKAPDWEEAFNQERAKFVAETLRAGRLHEECERLRAERDALRAALAELVALKDLKDSWDAKHAAGAAPSMIDFGYYERKPLAWDAARIALAPKENDK
jgi:hypothetical protein